jgi:hypothetical protein
MRTSQSPGIPDQPASSPNSSFRSSAIVEAYHTPCHCESITVDRIPAPESEVILHHSHQILTIQIAKPLARHAYREGEDRALSLNRAESSWDGYALAATVGSEAAYWAIAAGAGVVGNALAEFVLAGVAGKSRGKKGKRVEKEEKVHRCGVAGVDGSRCDARRGHVRVSFGGCSLMSFHEFPMLIRG